MTAAWNPAAAEPGSASLLAVLEAAPLETLQPHEAPPGLSASWRWGTASVPPRVAEGELPSPSCSGL